MTARLGAWCPDGHGSLLYSDAWAPRLYCPHLDHGANGAFFDPGSLESGYVPSQTASAAAAAREERAAAARAKRDAYEAEKAAEAKAEAARRAAPTPRTPRPRPTAGGQPCRCKCGGTTKGGRFLPGHDARFHAAEKRIAAGTGTAADKVMVAPMP